jgi:hypothetical protein
VAPRDKAKKKNANIDRIAKENERTRNKQFHTTVEEKEGEEEILEIERRTFNKKEKTWRASESMKMRKHKKNERERGAVYCVYVRKRGKKTQLPVKSTQVVSDGKVRRDHGKGKKKRRLNK